jgi:hypothetical protein
MLAIRMEASIGRQFFTRRYRDRRVGITAPPMLTAITVLGQSVTSGTT